MKIFRGLGLKGARINLAIALIALATIFAFQNCSQPHSSSVEASSINPPPLDPAHHDLSAEKTQAELTLQNSVLNQLQLLMQACATSGTNGSACSMVGLTVAQEREVMEALMNPSYKIKIVADFIPQVQQFTDQYQSILGSTPDERLADLMNLQTTILTDLEKLRTGCFGTQDVLACLKMASAAANQAAEVGHAAQDSNYRMSLVAAFIGDVSDYFNTHQPGT